MTKGRKMLLLAAFVLASAGGLFYFFREPADPVYRGKPLSVWVASMKEHDTMFSGGNPELNAFLQDLDQLGIKLLGKYVSRRSLSQRKYYRAIYNVLPAKAKTLFPKPDLKQQLRINAAWMLCELKQKAKPACRDLSTAVADLELNGRIRELAARTLFYFGRDAEPAIGALTKA